MIGSEFIPFQNSNNCLEHLHEIKATFIDGFTLVSGHCPKGGMDIWAEEIADELGITKEIYRPEINQWNDKGLTYGINDDCTPLEVAKGYKSRNIQIAKACDVLYCIVPKKPDYDPEYAAYCSQSHCNHCNQWGHPTNGGCWTKRYAKEKLGKETHLVVIE